jgi:hypothetical protein
MLRGGAAGNRTRVDGFAGRCLSHSATAPTPVTIPGGQVAVRHDGGMRSARRLSLTAAAVLLVPLVVAGCEDGDDAAGRPTCRGTVEQAAESIEVADQIRMLDEALRWCGSYDAYLFELTEHPGLVGYSPATYIELRCRAVTEPQLRGTPTCRTAHPPTTPPADTRPDLVYAAATLDGRVIELRPSPAVPFTGDVPSVVQETVDIAIEANCPGVLAQRDVWADRAAAEAGTEGGDIASAYAQHAIHVALWIGCENAELAPPGSAPAG